MVRIKKVDVNIAWSLACCAGLLFGLARYVFGWLWLLEIPVLICFLGFTRKMKCSCCGKELSLWTVTRAINSPFYCHRCGKRIEIE